MPQSTGKQADVIFASSEENRDLFYAIRMSVPDPILFFRIRGRKYLVASDLEIGRARTFATVHHVLPLSRYMKRLKRRGAANPTLTDVVISVLAEKGVRRARVPHDFPVFVADRLRRAGISVKPVDGPFWPERVRKTPEEIGAIRRAAVLTGEAMEAGIDLIRRSKPVRGRLRLDGRPLTSERVRAAIEIALLERNLLARNTIVAGGGQAVDPHHTGEGPLPSGYPVIIDCFPRDNGNGYHADITRTVFRGRPNRRQREMWVAVKDAQALGCEMIRPGVEGREIHRAIQDLFQERGFETGPVDGRMQGFFHGTGHGLGLAVHEAPSVGARPGTLEEGMVVTVEPGLYYRDLGGIRIEDDVAVTRSGHENLVPMEKTFEL